MIVPDSMSFENQQGAAMGDYIVRGPQGEYYGRYPTYPKQDQIPLYAIVEKVRDHRSLGQDDGSMF